MCVKTFQRFLSFFLKLKNEKEAAKKETYWYSQKRRDEQNLSDEFDGFFFSFLIQLPFCVYGVP